MGTLAGTGALLIGCLLAGACCGDDCGTSFTLLPRLQGLSLVVGLLEEPAVLVPRRVAKSAGRAIFLGGS